MKNSKQKCNGSVILSEETVSFGGMLLQYRLMAGCASRERFFVRINNGEETAESGLGNSIEDALRIYRAILGGRVTPCGLQDVLFDLRRSI